MFIFHVILQLNEEISRRSPRFVFSKSEEWWTVLNEKVAKNRESVRQNSLDKTVPLNYYATFDEVWL